MQLDVFKNLEQYTKRNRNRSFWRKVVRFLAGCVVFCTTYALILPAITMEQPTFCEFTEHAHTEECYIQHDVSTNLICSPESLVHTHSASCFDEFGNVICGLADYIGHTHTAECYDAENRLVCSLLETTWHVHDETCLSPAEPVLICGTVEGEIHFHNDSCYITQVITTNDLICPLDETQGHVHGAECYDLEGNLICTELEAAPHVHGDGCYATLEEKLLVCNLVEGEGHCHVNSCYDLQEGVTVLSCNPYNTVAHIHTESCYDELGNIVCGLADYVAHVHDAQYCYDALGNLVCTFLETAEHNHDETCVAVGEQPLTCVLEENDEHTHNFLCYGTWELVCTEEEHAHDLRCFSNPEADLETAEDWESSLSSVSLSGVWADDVVAIAESQVGYTESELNYVVLEDGITTLGYTRYGEWFGIPYENWDAMFASFCLRYAGVEGISLSENCAAWVGDLSAGWQNLYRSADEYEPKHGDLVFFDTDGDAVADHVGIVAEVIAATEFEPASILTVEGNVDNCVQYMTYELGDASIMGYGMLPAQENVTYTYNYYDGIVEVSVEIPAESGVPADAILSVTPIDIQNPDYFNLLAQAEDVVGNNISQILFYDISFYTTELEYIPVSDSAKVTMRLADSIIGSSSNTIVLHYDDENESAPVIISDVTVDEETVVAATTFSLRAEVIETTETVVSFETDGFSNFAIVDIDSLYAYDNPEGLHMDPWSGVYIGTLYGNPGLPYSLDALKEIVSKGGATFNIIYMPDAGANALTPQAHFNAWAMPTYYANGNLTGETCECELDMDVTPLPDGTYMATVSLDRLLNRFTSGEFGNKTIDDITNFTLQAAGNKGMTLYKAWFDTDVAYEDLFDEEIVVFDNPNGETMYRVTTNASISGPDGYQYWKVGDNIADTSLYSDASRYIVLNNGNGTYTVYDKNAKQPIAAWEGFGEGKIGNDAYDTFANYTLEDIKDLLKLGNVTFSMTFSGNPTNYADSNMSVYINAWNDYKLALLDDCASTYGHMVDNGDGTHTVTFSLDALVEKYTAAGNSIDSINNFIVQPFFENFKLHKAWFNTDVDYKDLIQDQLVVFNKPLGETIYCASGDPNESANGYKYKVVGTDITDITQYEGNASYTWKLNEGGTTYTVYKKDEKQPISATDGFGEGNTNWGQPYNHFETLTIEEIREIFALGNVTFNMTFSGNPVDWGNMTFYINAWDGNKIEIPDDLVTPNGYMVDNNDGTRTVTVSIDALLAEYLAAGNSIDSINNFTIQPLYDNFKLYKAWFDTTGSYIAPALPPESVSCEVETKQAVANGTVGAHSADPENPVTATKTVNDDGSVTVTNMNQIIIPLDKTISADGTVVVHFKGTSTDPFRLWISDVAGGTNSVMVYASNLGYTGNGSFDYYVELTANGAQQYLTFKHEQYNGNIGSFTLDHVGVYYGTYNQFFDAAYNYDNNLTELELFNGLKNGIQSGHGFGEGDFNAHGGGIFNYFSISLEELVKYAKRGATLHYTITSYGEPVSSITQFNAVTSSHEKYNEAYKVDITGNVNLISTDAETDIHTYEGSVSLNDVYNAYVRAGGKDSDIINFAVETTISEGYSTYNLTRAWLEITNDGVIVTPPEETGETVVFENSAGVNYNRNAEFAIGPGYDSIPGIGNLTIDQLRELASDPDTELIIEFAASADGAIKLKLNGGNEQTYNITSNGDNTVSVKVNLSDLLEEKNITVDQLNSLSVFVDCEGFSLRKISFVGPDTDEPAEPEASEQMELIYKLNQVIDGNNSTVLSDGLGISWWTNLVSEYVGNDARYQLQLLKTALTVDGAKIRITYTGDSNLSVILQNYALDDGVEFPSANISEYTITTDENGNKVATFDANALINTYLNTPHPDDTTGQTKLTFDKLLNLAVGGNGNTIYSFEVVAPVADYRPVINLDEQIAAIIAVNNYINPAASYSGNVVYPAVASSPIGGNTLVGADIDSFTVDAEGNATISDDDLALYGAEGNRIVWEFTAVRDGDGVPILGQYYIQAVNYYGPDYSYPENPEAGKYLNISSTGITLSGEKQAIEVVEHTPTGYGTLIDENIVCFRVKENDVYYYLQLENNYGDRNFATSVAPHDTVHFLGNQFVVVDIVDDAVESLKDAIDELPTTAEFAQKCASYNKGNQEEYDALCKYREDMRNLAIQVKQQYDDLVAAGGDVALQLNFVGKERIEKLLENLEWLWRKEPNVVPGVKLNATLKLFNYDKTANDHQFTTDETDNSGNTIVPTYQFYDWDTNSVDVGSGNHPPVGPAARGPTIKNTLSNGYPEIVRIAMAVGKDENGNDIIEYVPITSGGNMDYLFGGENVGDGYLKAIIPDTGGLFQQDEDGYYYYYSNTNSAWYNPATNSFVLYDAVVRPKSEADLSNFIIYDADKKIIDYNGNLVYGSDGNPITLEEAIERRNEALSNFLPFNEIIGNVIYDFPDDAYPEDSTNHYIDKVTPTVGTEKVDTMYLNSEVDLWFGMSIEFEFFVPEDALVNGKPMEFDFHGDDDVFVYIDDVFVLDIGGCHEALDGYINFATGKVKDPSKGNDVYLADVFRNAGYTEEQIAEQFVYDSALGKYTTFKEFTKHHLNFFYMERGGSISYSGIRFNLPTVPEYSLMVSKELDAEINTNIDYTFRVNKVVGGEVTEQSLIPVGIQFSIFENWIDTGLKGTVDENGFFTLKAGQTAVFPKFSAEELGTNDYYVQEYLPNDMARQYEVSYTTNAMDRYITFAPNNQNVVALNNPGGWTDLSSAPSYDGFGVGEVNVNGRRIGEGISLSRIKEIVSSGGTTFNMIFSGTASGWQPMQAQLSAWDMPTYDRDGNLREDRKECEVEPTYTDLGNGRYQVSFDLYELFRLYTDKDYANEKLGYNFGDKTVDDITNFAIQTGHNNFILYEAWFEYPDTITAQDTVNGENYLYHQTEKLNLNTSQIVTYKNTAVEPTGELWITKVERTSGSFDSDKVFQMQVMVGDGSLATNPAARAMLIPLPVGTKYTVSIGNTTTGVITGGQTIEKTVESPGIIELAVGQTAQIHGILAGTYFEVTELIGSDDRFDAFYNVTYDSDYTTSRTWYDALSISGLFQYIGDTYHVMVTNTINEYVYDIPISKVVEGYSGPSAFEFEVSYEVSVFNETTGEWEPTTETNKSSITVTSSDVVDGDIRVAFDANDLDENGSLVFKLVEIKGDGNFIYDDSEYYIYIKVNDETGKAYVDKICTYVKNNQGETIFADVTSSFEKNDEGVPVTSFVNYALTNLTVSKEVVNLIGDDTSGSFPFEVLAHYTINELPTIDGVTCSWEDAEARLIKYTFNLSHGGSITIPVAPNTKVTVRETFNDGYSTRYQIDSGAETGGTKAEFTIGTTDANIKFTNQIGYALPKTGGSGTILYTAGGILLLAIFAVLLYNKITCGKEERASS